MQDLFEHLDVLVYVEALIYQMDEENEDMSGQGAVAQDHEFQGAAVLSATLYMPADSDPNADMRVA